MNDASGDGRDSSGRVVRPPIAWMLAVAAGLALDWLYPLPFLPSAVVRWFGGFAFVAGLGLLIWAASTFRRAGTEVRGSRPTTTIVTGGPYGYSRNPIYVGMVLGLLGLAIAFDSLWFVVVLVPFCVLIRYGVVAREEAYLNRKFGDVYRAYASRVRRWL